MTVLICLIPGGLVIVDASKHPTWPLDATTEGHRFFCGCVTYQPDLSP